MTMSWRQRGCLLVLPIAMSVYPATYAADRFGGSVAVTSDYIYRGISHSRGQLAIQAGVHARLNNNGDSDWRVGIWGSTIEHAYSGSNAFELDGFIAYQRSLDANWQLRAAVTHYGFVADHSIWGYDYDELSLAMNYQSRVLLSVAWLPNVARAHQDIHSGYFVVTRRRAAAADLNFVQPLSDAWSAMIGIGYYDISATGFTGYAYGHAGVTATYGPIDLDLLYIDSEHAAKAAYGAALTGSRWAATVRRRF
jgi:uncharacterized protein (TIGR02001 family)